jgi:hypothetical protein
MNHMGKAAQKRYIYYLAGWIVFKIEKPKDTVRCLICLVFLIFAVSFSRTTSDNQCCNKGNRDNRHRQQ